MKDIVTTYVYRCGCSFPDHTKPFAQRSWDGQITCPNHPKIRLYYRERYCQRCGVLMLLDRHQTRKIYCENCRVIMKRLTTKRYYEERQRIGALPCQDAQTEIEKPWWMTERGRVLKIIAKVGDKFTPPVVKTPFLDSIIVNTHTGEAA